MSVMASEAELMRSRARALRGPWWWRLRCWLADRACEVGCLLEPGDRSSMHWYSDDGSSVYFAQIRRAKPAARRDLHSVS